MKELQLAFDPKLAFGDHLLTNMKEQLLLLTQKGI